MIVRIYTAVHSQNCYSSTLLVSYIHVPVQACLPSILCYLDKLTVLTLYVCFLSKGHHHRIIREVHTLEEIPTSALYYLTTTILIYAVEGEPGSVFNLINNSKFYSHECHVYAQFR